MLLLSQYDFMARYLIKQWIRLHGVGLSEAEGYIYIYMESNITRAGYMHRIWKDEIKTIIVGESS
jgi:hypothetical protein